jgi:hypothetical protein
MDRNEYIAWVSKNVGKGGQIPRIDPFNKKQKGNERNKRAEEYPCKDVEEFQKYQERHNLKKEDDKKDNSTQSTNKKRNQQNNAIKKQNLIRNVAKQIISKVVLVVVGAIIIVVSYTAVTERDKVIAQEPLVASTVWTWDENKETATVDLLDENDNLIVQLPTTITVVTVDATCTKDGSITYTAKALKGDKEYTDTKIEIIEALGHHFGEGTETILENGNHATVYECDRCHEKFTIETSVTEEEEEE